MLKGNPEGSKKAIETQIWPCPFLMFLEVEVHVFGNIHFRPCLEVFTRLTVWSGIKAITE
jgi:hypothetical protein